MMIVEYRDMDVRSNAADMVAIDLSRVVAVERGSVGGTLYLRCDGHFFVVSANYDDVLRDWKAAKA